MTYRDRILPALLTLGPALLLAGCGESFDARQQRICRQAIVPLNPPGSVIAIETVAEGPRKDVLRIRYRNDSLGGRRRVVDCLFAAPGSGERPGRLIGIASDGEPLSGARFFMLRRFYLEDAENPPPDPGGKP